MSKQSPANLSAAEFFGWKRNPFIDLPGDFGIESLSVKRDQEIAHRAKEFIKVNRSFAIIGTPGAGKTTLVKTIVNSLDPRSFSPFWLPYAGCNRAGVLRILAEKVGLELSRKGLPPLHKLQRHLATQQKEPGSPFPIIVIDDAQQLEVESIMDLCAILAHPDDQRALTSLILVGDENLDHLLRLKSRKAITSRMACVFRVEALNQDETRNLLVRRLEIAKAPKNLFDEEAMELMATQCRGNRRELMNLGIRLCIEAHAREEKSITAEIVLTQETIQ